MRSQAEHLRSRSAKLNTGDFSANGQELQWLRNSTPPRVPIWGTA
jgi:hypothetical protein